MRIILVLVLGALVVTIVDFTLGIWIRPVWKQVLHNVTYMAWGASVYACRRRKDIYHGLMEH